MKYKNKIWTFENLQKEVDKCKSRVEFSKKNSGAYSVAKKQKLLNKLFINHINNGYSNNQVKCGFWTFDNVQKEANKYKLRIMFQKESSGAFDKAHKNGWLDEIFKNHENYGYTDRKNINKKYTFDFVNSEAKKYDLRRTFSKKSSGAYDAACRNGWLDEIFKNHKNNGYYTLNEDYKYVVYAYEIPLLNSVYVGLTNNIKRRDNEHIYNLTENLNIFCRNNNIPLPKPIILKSDLNPYEAITYEEKYLNVYINNGWNTLNIAKTGSLGGSLKKYFFNELKENVKDYKTRGEFRNAMISAYGAASKNGWIDELFENHPNNGFLEDRISVNFIWSFERLQEEVNKYELRNQFRLECSGAYSAAYENGWLDKLFSNHKNNGKLRNRDRKSWDYNSCKEEALKYNSRTKFCKGSSAYSYACKNNILDDICSHMKYERIYWDYGLCKIEASKYINRRKFQDGTKSAYNYARKNNLLDEFFPKTK